MANTNGRDFFSQSKKQYGDDFLRYMNARDLQLKAPQIFRQMAKGQINVVENGKYFLDRTFLEACMIAANSKYVLHSISRDGVDLLIKNMISNNAQITNDMNAVFDFHLRSAEAYGEILNALNIINNTMTTDCLLPLVSRLANYRNYI